MFLPRGSGSGSDFSSQRAYYDVCLVILLLRVFVVARLRASGIGRSIIAVRDDEAAASSFSVAGGVEAHRLRLRRRHRAWPVR